jgi:signal transduction histidine kinase
MSAPAAARLLIVDDEAAQLQALCDILGQEGYLTRGFADGREALAALREEPFDALLTDLMMPQIDGITLLRACREIDRDLACIVMTGHATVSTAVESLKAGADDYVMKPFNVSQILGALTRALDLRRLKLENIQLRESVSIYELARGITQVLSRAEILKRTLAAAAALSDCRAVYLLEQTGTAEPAVRLAGSAGPLAPPLKSTSPPGLVLADWVQRATEELDTLTAASSVAALVEHPFDRALGIALPVLAAGQLFGVLGFTSADARHPVRIGQVKTLDVLARTAAGAFARAALVTELREMNRVLEQRVDERTHELEAFTHSVAHDLRAPLRGINGIAEILSESKLQQLDAEGRKYLRLIVESGNRMGQLIDDLLKLSRITRDELVRESIDLSGLVREVMQQLRDAHPNQQVTLVVADGVCAAADPRLLRIVLENLLGNAWKFSSQRASARIEFGVDQQQGAPVYFIRDNGVGFDMRYAEKLFGVFQRLHRTDEFEGTGIGLSIVHRIVTRHGGKVWAESRKGEGTTLYFSLPGLASVSQPDAMPQECAS